MIAEDITVEWDEGGCYLHVDGETWRVADPEQLYDRVKAAILPWLMEREHAFDQFRANVAAGAFRCADPEGDWAEMMRDNADHSRKVAKGE